MSAPDRPDPLPRTSRWETQIGQQPVTLDVATLFDGKSEIRLLHRGQEYRLRVTKQGKLILTK